MLEQYKNKIIHADCMNILKELPDNSIDLVVTDPPYEIVNTRAGGHSELTKSFQSFNDDLVELNLHKNLGVEWCKEIPRIQKNINCYIWCNKAQIKQYLDYFTGNLNCSFDILIWNKTNPIPAFSNKYMPDKEYCLYFRKNSYCQPQGFENARTVFNYPINKKDKDKYGHPTIKPLSIIETLIKNSSKEGHFVLDCFSGSGTTAVACVRSNRNFICIEKDEKYYNVSQERVKNETAQLKLL